MFVIEQKSKKIILTRGDTASMLIGVQDINGKEYEFEDGDIITFTMRKSPKSERALQLVADENHYIVFAPEDTNNLESGLYIYQVQLQSGDNIYTIVPTSFFELREDLVR